MRTTARIPSLKTNGREKPTIVQILPNLVAGGVERGTVDIARSIQEHGGRAIVVSNGGPLVRHIERCGGVHYKLDVHSKNPFRWLSIRRKLKVILEKENASLIHVRSRAPGWIALPVAKEMGLPSVATIHGRFIASNIIKRFYNAKILTADMIIVISDYIRHVVTTQFKGKEKRLTVVHRGVDTHYFDPKGISHTRIINFADSVALPEDVPVIMLPGRPTSWKGHKILLEALSKIVDKKFICLMVGAADGTKSFVASLTDQGQRLGLEGRFRLTQSSTDMPAALMVSDVVVMPSITPEPFGRVALEAQAMGRPIIAFNHGGAKESVIHKETGWLVTPSDADQLAQAVREAISLTSRKRNKMAKRAREHILQNFSTEIMCRKTFEVYLRLLNKV